MKVDYEGLQEEYTYLCVIIDSTMERMKTIKDTVKALKRDSKWKGESYNEFKSIIDKMDLVISQTSASAYIYANQLAQTAKKYRNLEMRIANQAMGKSE